MKDDGGHLIPLSIRDYIDATAFGSANKEWLAGLKDITGTFTGTYNASWPYGTILRHPSFGSVMVIGTGRTVDLHSGMIEEGCDYFGQGWEVVDE